MEGSHQDASPNSDSQARELSDFFNVVRMAMMEYEAQHLSTPLLKDVYAAIQQKMLGIPPNETSELVYRQSKLPVIRLIWRDVVCQSLAFGPQDVPVMVHSSSPYLNSSLNTGTTQIYVEYVNEIFDVPWLYNVAFDDLNYKSFYKDVITRNPNKDISDHVKAILWTFVISSVYPDENRNSQRLKIREGLPANVMEKDVPPLLSAKFIPTFILPEVADMGFQSFSSFVLDYHWLNPKDGIERDLVMQAWLIACRASLSVPETLRVEISDHMWSTERMRLYWLAIEQRREARLIEEGEGPKSQLHKVEDMMLCVDKELYVVPMARNPRKPHLAPFVNFAVQFVALNSNLPLTKDLIIAKFASFNRGDWVNEQVSNEAAEEYWAANPRFLPSDSDDEDTMHGPRPEAQSATQALNLCFKMIRNSMHTDEKEKTALDSTAANEALQLLYNHIEAQDKTISDTVAANKSLLIENQNLVDQQQCRVDDNSKTLDENEKLKKELKKREEQYDKLEKQHQQLLTLRRRLQGAIEGQTKAAREACQDYHRNQRG